MICGDNLGSHQIGGYLESFSKSEHFCRYCKITHTQFHSNHNFKAEFRTPENYLQSLNNKGSAPHYEGIKFNSPFNELSEFHVTNPGLPPCIGHDLYEGIIPSDLWLFIQYFVSQNWFNYDQLNHYFNKYRKILKVQTSFPRITSNIKKIPGHAYQNFMFIIIFPTVVYAIWKSSDNSPIDFENSTWKLVIMLLEITQIVSSHSITYNQIHYLEFLIYQYLNSLKSHFPEIKLKPKHHYIQHYPQLILEFGPLIKFSTLRFESKHQFFKHISSTTKNFVNITQTLTTKHQFYQAPLSFNRVSSPTIIKNPISSHGSRHSEYKFLSAKVSFNNISYEKNQFVILQKNINNEIIILNIEIILTNNEQNKITFFGRIYTMIYNYKAGLYEMDETEELRYVELSELYYSFPFNACKVDDEYISTMNHGVLF